MGSCFRTGKKKNSYTVTQIDEEYGPVAGKYNTNRAEQNKWMAEAGQAKSQAPRLPPNVKPLAEFEINKNAQANSKQNGVHQEEDNSNKIQQADFTKNQMTSKTMTIAPVEKKRSPSPARRRSPSPERKRSPSPERKHSPSPERRSRSSSPETKRSPSPERKRSPSPERRSPSPVRRSPSPERRSPSPERRSPSPERRSPSQEFFQSSVTTVTTSAVELEIPDIQVIEASEAGSSVGIQDDLKNRDQDSDSDGSPRYTEPPQIVSYEEYSVDQPEPVKEVRSVSFSDAVARDDSSSSDEDDKVDMDQFRNDYNATHPEVGFPTSTVVTVTSGEIYENYDDDEIRPPTDFENTYDEVQITESPAGTWDARLNSEVRAELDEARRSLSSSKASSTASLDNPENVGVSVVTVTSTTYTTENHYEMDNDANDRIVSMSIDKEIPADEIQLDDNLEVNYADPGDPSHTINPQELY